MKRSIASYLGSKLRRHAFINFLLFLEMTVALIFGAIGFEMLATAQDAIAEYPSEYERLSVVSGVYGEKQTNEEILEICEGKGYSFIYPLALKNVMFETAWEGQIVQTTIASLMSYRLEDGEWFDTSSAFKNGVRQAVVDDIFCEAKGCKAGDVITIEYRIGKQYFPLEVIIVGVNDFSSTGIGIGYDGTLMKSNMSADDGMITVLAEDGDLCFLDASVFNAFILDMSGNDKEAFMKAGIRITESVADDYDQYYAQQINTRNVMLMLCVSVMLLAASTALTASAIMFGRQKRENAIAFACGLSRKNAIVGEAVKDALVLAFALIAGAAFAAIAAGTGMLPGVNGMSGFAISAAIVAVLYISVKAPFLTALGKTEPIEGIKEKTL